MKTRNNIQQEGGNHYERLKVEPVKVFVAFKMNWFQGEILKYVSRFQRKNGEQDLKKGLHIADMAIDLNIGKMNRVKVIRLLSKKKHLNDLFHDYVNQFEYVEYMTILLIGLIEENYDSVKENINELIKKYYG